MPERLIDKNYDVLEPARSREEMKRRLSMMDTEGISDPTFSLVFRYRDAPDPDADWQKLRTLDGEPEVEKLNYRQRFDKILANLLEEYVPGIVQASRSHGMFNARVPEVSEMASHAYRRLQESEATPESYKMVAALLGAPLSMLDRETIPEIGKALKEVASQATEEGVLLEEMRVALIDPSYGTTIVSHAGKEYSERGLCTPDRSGWLHPDSARARAADPVRMPEKVSTVYVPFTI